MVRKRSTENKPWREAGLPTPPVMVTVANRTETAARVKYAFESRRIHIDELCDPERLLHIDSKVLDRLRRTTYEVNPETGLFEPEYVNIFGVPFTILPHEGGEDGPPPPPSPKTAVEPDPTKAKFEIRWPFDVNARAYR